MAALQDALHDNDPSVQWDAAVALGCLKDARAAPSLIAALKDSEVGFRAQASLALAAIGAPAVEPLIAALRDADWRVRWEAVSTLGMIRDPRAADVVSRRAEASAAVADAYVELVKKAEPGTEDSLIDALGALGTTGMARDFLGCDNPKLEEAGRRWLENHDYTTSNFPKIRKGPRWGGRPIGR